MELQQDVAAVEPKQEWVAPELVKMDVSSGTLNSTGTNPDAGLGSS